MINGSKGPLYYRTDPRTFIRELPGIGSKLLPRVIEDLGNGDPEEALLEIERNPYTLTEVDGIGFKKADKIATLTFEVEDDDPRRHEAGNRYILEQRGVLSQREFIAERLKLELRDPDHIQSGIEIEDGLYWLPEELAAEKGLERWMRGIHVGEPALAELTEAQQAVCKSLTLDEQQTTAVRASQSRWAVPGALHIELSEVIVLPRPVPCPGKQGLWELDEANERAVQQELLRWSAGLIPPDSRKGAAEWLR